MTREKTSALQALALWDGGVRRWQERYRGRHSPEKRPGVTMNRRDLIAVPVPKANLLWRNLQTRLGSRENGRQRTENVRIDIVVEGVTDDKVWRCGLEFDYANEESFYCRPLRVAGAAGGEERMPVPEQALLTRVAYLPPMSGLAAEEPKWEPGRINVLIGEGRTAQVLRNLCHNLAEHQQREWRKVQERILELFGVQLNQPQFIRERGEITMSYTDASGVTLALAASGRGLQQTLLLLAYLYTNPSAVLLLDEPDAHLEILRQRQVYGLLSQIASEVGGQIVAASHSEVILNEAATRDVVVAFVGRPHRIDDRSSQTQVAKSLKQIGYEAYYQAEQTGWALYLEGSTDLALLRSFAKTLGHAASKHLARPFVSYVGNQPNKARDHFHGLREAKPDLVGLGVFDHDARVEKSHPNLIEIRWQRREIENYLPLPAVLYRYATSSGNADSRSPLFSEILANTRLAAMKAVVEDLVPPRALRDPDFAYWREERASGLLDRVFEEYFKELKLANAMRKSTYHRLASLAEPQELDEDVRRILDRIVEVAQRAGPVGG